MREHITICCHNLEWMPSTSRSRAIRSALDIFGDRGVDDLDADRGLEERGVLIFTEPLLVRAGGSKPTRAVTTKNRACNFCPAGKSKVGAVAHVM